MVSVPGVNPSEAEVVVTVRVAVAWLLLAIVTWLTVPIVFPPVVNVTGPVSVPGVVPWITAFRVKLAPKAKLLGLADTLVDVVAVPLAMTVRFTTGLFELV